MAVLSILFVLVTLLVAALLTKEFVSQPILALSGNLAHVATYYDLTQQTKVLTNDEIGDISRRLNILLSSLSTALHDVKQAASNTQQSVSILSNTAEAADQQIDVMTANIENVGQHNNLSRAAQVAASKMPPAQPARTQKVLKSAPKQCMARQKVLAA